MIDWTILSDNLGIVILAVLASIPVLGFLHLAACALCDIEARYWFSTLQGSLTFLAAVIVGIFLVPVMGQQSPKFDEGGFNLYHSLGLAVTLVVSWLIGAVVYTIVLKGRLGKGIRISMLEVSLRALALALVGGLIGVAYAIGQVAQDSQGRTALIYIGVAFGVLIAVVVAIFLLTSSLRSQSGPR